MINPIFVHRNIETGKFVVSIACQGLFRPVYIWKTTDTSWMDDENIGNNGQIPSMDLIEDERFVFNSESEAFRKVAELYAAQL